MVAVLAAQAAIYLMERIENDLPFISTTLDEVPCAGSTMLAVRDDGDDSQLTGVFSW